MLSSTIESENLSRSRKNGKKHNKIRLFLCVVAAAFAIYVIAALIAGLHSGISTVVATNGSISEGFRTTGYVFRNQEVITAPGGGYFECIVSDGERVKKGQTVAYMFGTQPDPSLMEQIRNVHELIRIKSGEVDAMIYSDNSSSSTSVVADKVRNMSDLRRDRDLSEVREKKGELDLIIGRNTDGTDTSKSLEELKSELNDLRSRAGSGAEIIAPEAGVFSSRIDGFEEMLDYEKLESVSPSYIAELDKMETSASNEIVAGQPLCKIVNNYTWAYASVVDEKEAENIKEGQSVEIQFFDLTNTSVKGTVSRISDAEGGKKAVVISTNRYVDRIYSTSRANGDVVLVKAEGIKLPAKCLHVVDGVTGVYVVRLDEAKFVPVNVGYKNDDWTVVSAAEPQLGEEKLQIYDEVIVSGRNIEDEKVVR